MQDTKPPEDKDALIKYLVERLSQAEQAIEAAEQCIEAERNSRKKVSKDIKAKNFELREIVNKEKKTLQDKVHQELEETLSAALQGKIEAENRLKEATDKIEEHTRLFEEMDDEIRRLKGDFNALDKETQGSRTRMEEMTAEIESLKQDNATLRDRVET